ncbi:MAG: glycine cleavage system protein T [Candidatus Latescibacteria bacterium 4484_107]|nr:MAG: glycine cleavage system protein T [Candidatus Latescibacteria bacterium 4484_107]
MATTVKNTPLRDSHARRGAKFTEFGGWNMPVQYKGIIHEHKHTRSAVSVFDICHMGEFLLKGAQAQGDVARLISNSVERIRVGQCRYGFLLNESGGILDDLITYRLEEETYMLVVNACPTEADAEWIREHLSPGTVFRELSEETAKIDVQGPRALEALSDAADIPLSRLAYFHFERGKLWEFEALISRTGYTGELGYELYVKSNAAEAIWERLLEHPLVEPAGLGARDTLRLEMGYPLYGQEMDEHRTPFEAGLDPYVKLKKDFIGRDALLRQRAEGISQGLVGLLLEGRQAARHGFPILRDGVPCGEVTSGSFAPSLGRAVSLGYVPWDHRAPGTRFEIRSGHRALTAEVVPLPFYKKGTVRA